MSKERKIFWAFARKALILHYVDNVALVSIRPLVVKVTWSGNPTWDCEQDLRVMFIECVRVLSPDDFSVGELHVCESGQP